MDNELEKRKRKIILIIGKILLLGFMSFLISPVLWIWYGWSIAWKVGLTGLLIWLIFTFIYKFIKDTLKEL
jgi:uncharacterized BrkB/YihY/UPF0761 family membrane protein